MMSEFDNVHEKQRARADARNYVLARPEGVEVAREIAVWIRERANEASVDVAVVARQIARDIEREFCGGPAR